MYEMLRTKSLFSFPQHTIAWQYLSQFHFPWQSLENLKEFLMELGKSLSKDRYEQTSEGVYVARSAKIASFVHIEGPAIIDEDAELRTGAFLRGGVLVGKEAVVGNSTEIKNSILFDGVQVPHFNYVGDSILGYRSHLGAGAVTSNVKSDKSEVSILYGEERIPTGRRKFGAILSDFVEVGCHSVLNPGSIIAEHSNVYPLTSVRGYVPPYHIYKSRDEVVLKKP